MHAHQNDRHQAKGAYSSNVHISSKILIAILRLRPIKVVGWKKNIFLKKQLKNMHPCIRAILAI